MRFSHPEFVVQPFDQIPTNRDIYLMAESWIDDYELAMVNFFEGRGDGIAGAISYAAARAIGENHVELSWYPDIVDRFHEVSVTLPRSSFVCCVECPGCDEKPRLFVRDAWLDNIYAKPFSIFAMIDAIGVKKAIADGSLDSTRLVDLRDRVDRLAIIHPDVAFISFADNLLLKVNWYPQSRGARSTYAPEVLIRLILDIARIFIEEVGLQIYSVVTQGENIYEDPALIHKSHGGNHISLNSVGFPFARLLSIDTAVRRAIKSGVHSESQLYLDKQFYNSLRLRPVVNKRQTPSAKYKDPMSDAEQEYYCLDVDIITSNLES